MPILVGSVESVPIVVQKDSAKTLTFKFEGDTSAKTYTFKAAEYSGASNDISRAATSATYSSPYTTVVFDLTTGDTGLSWVRGLYSVENTTDSLIAAEGPLRVKDVPN